MKVSELALENVAPAIRENLNYLNDDEKRHIDTLIAAAKSYALNYTGISSEEMDSHEDITVAVLMLISDMYDNRQIQVDKANINVVADTILSMYCVNLV